MNKFSLSFINAEKEQEYCNKEQQNISQYLIKLTIFSLICYVSLFLYAVILGLREYQFYIAISINFISFSLNLATTLYKQQYIDQINVICVTSLICTGYWLIFIDDLIDDQQNYLLGFLHSIILQLFIVGTKFIYKLTIISIISLFWSVAVFKQFNYFLFIGSMIAIPYFTFKIYYEEYQKRSIYLQQNNNIDYRLILKEHLPANFMILEFNQMQQQSFKLVFSNNNFNQNFNVTSEEQFECFVKKIFLENQNSHPEDNINPAISNFTNNNNASIKSHQSEQIPRSLYQYMLSKLEECNMKQSQRLSKQFIFKKSVSKVSMLSQYTTNDEMGQEQLIGSIKSDKGRTIKLLIFIKILTNHVFLLIHPDKHKEKTIVEKNKQKFQKKFFKKNIKYCLSFISKAIINYRQVFLAIQQQKHIYSEQVLNSTYECLLDTFVVKNNIYKQYIYLKKKKKITYQIKKINIRSEINSMLTVLNTIIKQKNIQIIQDIKLFNENVVQDAEKFIQLIFIMIYNAIIYAPDFGYLVIIVKTSLQNKDFIKFYLRNSIDSNPTQQICLSEIVDNNLGKSMTEDQILIFYEKYKSFKLGLRVAGKLVKLIGPFNDLQITFKKKQYFQASFQIFQNLEIVNQEKQQFILSPNIQFQESEQEDEHDTNQNDVLEKNNSEEFITEIIHDHQIKRNFMYNVVQ